MIITVTSYKGGVGKTTTAIHLAAYLHRLAPTLLVDGDAIRSATKWSQRSGHTGLPFKVVTHAQMVSHIRDHQNVIIDTEGNGPSWKDIPGAKFDASPPWREGRDLLEFVVAVDKHPEIGTLYFFVIVSLKPGQYRVQMSSALYSPYTGDSSPLGNSPQPWAEESGCTIKVDSGWLKAPAVPAAGGRQ